MRQHQVFTRPVRLYDEDREEAPPFQAITLRDRLRASTDPAIRVLADATDPYQGLAAYINGQRDVDTVTLQDEVEEADKVYDADRPHRPTTEEQERFWTDHLDRAQRARLAWRESKERDRAFMAGGKWYEVPADEPHKPTLEVAARQFLAAYDDYAKDRIATWPGWFHPALDTLREALEHPTAPHPWQETDNTAPTVGELIDRLTIVNIKIYHLEDTVMESTDSETVAAAAKKTRTLNRERSDLKNAITRLVQGSAARMDTKT